MPIGDGEANENRRGLYPHTLTSTIRTSELRAKLEVQVSQLIQILKCLKVPYFHQSVSSLVVSPHPERTSKPIASTEIQARQLAEPRQESQQLR